MEEPYFHLATGFYAFNPGSSEGQVVAERVDCLPDTYTYSMIALPFSPPAFCFATVAKSSRLELVDIKTMF